MANDTETYRALVVDDEAIARKMLTFALGEEGFSCDAASDGMQALNLIRGRNYDLVVTDLRMPNKHGHALAVDLLADEHRPILMICTAVDHPRLTKDLMFRGVDDIVYKPLNYETLAARAKVLVDKRRTTQADTSKERSNPSTLDANPGRSSSDAPDMPDPQRPLARSELDKRLADVKDVLPLSQTALSVYRLATEGNVEKTAIASAIQQDGALTTDILRIGNSAHYNRSGEQIADLEKVVVRVGRRRIGELALAASARAVVTKQQIPWLDVELAWKRSIAAGIALDALVSQGRHVRVEKGLFLSALMHPLGRIVLATVYPSRHEALTRECAQNGKSLSPAEKRLFHKPHTEIMAELLGGWRIPAEVTLPLKHALDPFPLVRTLPENERTRVELLKLAIVIGRLAVGSWQPWDMVDLPPADFVKRLRIRSVTEIISETRTKIEQLAGSEERSSASIVADQGAMSVRKIGYWNSSGETYDFLAGIFPAIGIEPAFSELEGQPFVLANCLNAESSQSLAQLKLREDQDLLIVTRQDSRDQFEKLGRVLVLPTGFGQLRDAILAAAGK